MNDKQPTVEQSLHSIALSMIEINKELREARRTQTKAFRFTKQETRWPNSHTPPPPVPEKRTLWDWLRGWATA